MQDHRCFRTKAHASAGTKAFTLVELLVVVAIIALLVTILMPSLGRAMELARRALCASNLHAQGQAWHVYWKEYNDRTPPLQNPRILRDGNPVSDISGQWHRLIWVGNDAAYGLGPGVKPQWLGAGVLYGQKLVGSQRIYVCPTIERNCPWPWFHEDEGWDNNLWPVSRRFCTSSTYGQRRCMQYDDPSLSAGGTMNPVDDHIMFLESGVTIVKRPGDFAFMTDRFDTPEMALRSHVPGINVLNMGGNVHFWEDTTDEGTVLYDNGLDGSTYGSASNYIFDDIWMVIDKYHQPPPGL